LPVASALERSEREASSSSSERRIAVARLASALVNGLASL